MTNSISVPSNIFMAKLTTKFGIDWLRKALLAEERPGNMLILLFTLVLLLHVWALFWLLQPSDIAPVTEKPLLMEVSMLSIAAAKPSAAPPKAAPPQEKKPEPKKTGT